MRRHSASLLLAIVLLVGCQLGQRARDEALLPALRMAAVGICEDAIRGGDDAASVAAEAFMNALRAESLDQPAITEGWVAVSAYAKLGISVRVASGEIGPAVAESLLERIKQFDIGIQKYFEKDTRP